MEEGSKKQKGILFYSGFGLIGLLSILIVGLWLYCYWKGKVDDENGYNSINAVIAGFTLLVNIITIAFVYSTFKLQSDEINRNRKDVEFNRALDIIYRQLEHTNDKFKFTNYENSLKNIKNYEIFDWFDSIYDIQKIISSLKYETDFYIKLLKKSNLENADKEYLFKIYTSNIKVEIKEIFHSSLKFVKDSKEDEKLEKSFKGYFEYTNINSYDNSTGGYFNQDEMNKELSLLRSVLRNLKDIDRIFYQYNVWEK